MSSNPSPAIAALLSFLFPGAGQIYAGETRKGIIWAIPMLIFVIAVVGLLLSGPTAMLNLISSPQKRLALLTLNFAFFLYHLAAMFDAYAVAQRRGERSFGYSSAAPIVLAVLVSVTLIMHGLPEVYGYKVHETMTALLSDNPDDVIPQVSFAPHTQGPQTPTPAASPTPATSATPGASATPGSSGTPGPTGGPQATTAPKVCPPPVDLASWPAWAQDGKLNILVAGTDSRSDTGVDDNSLRTDTMLLMSIDIQDCKAAMFSFPRNMCTPSIDRSCGPAGSESRYPDWLKINLPAESAGAYPNGVFPDMLNALWRRAAERPESFPGSEGVSAQDCPQQFDCTRAWRALVGTIQDMAGVQIDGIVAVNLKGFVSLIDNLPPQCPPNAVRMALTNQDCYGGVWIDVPTAVHDDVYHTSQQDQIVIDIEKGCQFFDAEMALAYSRSRHETSDYDRVRRQQYVLTQIRKQLDPVGLLPHIPALLQVAQENIFLTFSDADIPYLAEAASRIDADRIYRFAFAPGGVGDLGSMQGIRDKVTGIFDEPEPEPEVKPNQAPCPPRN